MSANAAEVAGSSVEDRIYDAVVCSVLGRRLLPGTKLPEAALCELFGVGRSVVQKVLQRLAHEHVIELRPNRGARVAMPTREEVTELFEARRALETAILPLVAQRAGKADYAKLRQHLHDEHAAMHQSDQTAWARLASAFHLALGELGGNALLARYLAETISRTSLMVAIFQPPGNATCEHHEHRQVVDLLEEGKLGQATQVMNTHLCAVEQRLQLADDEPSNSLAQMLGL